MVPKELIEIYASVLKRGRVLCCRPVPLYGANVFMVTVFYSGVIDYIDRFGRLSPVAAAQMTYGSFVMSPSTICKRHEAIKNGFVELACLEENNFYTDSEWAKI